jgi:hypothetical protein
MLSRSIWEQNLLETRVKSEREISSGLASDMTTKARTPMQPLLSSWEEIADYLKRGVRTTQRWKVEKSLPTLGSEPGVKLLCSPSALKFRTGCALTNSINHPDWKTDGHTNPGASGLGGPSARARAASVDA